MTTALTSLAGPTMARDDYAIVSLTEALCAHRSGVVAAENEAMFAHLGRELPLTLRRFASGDEHLGWRVPPRCDVLEAIVERDGEVILDGREHPLVVAQGCRSFEGEVDLDELQAHLVTNPDEPDAYVFHCQWQYRPWQADWALSIPYARYAELRPGRYSVRVRTRQVDDHMLVAEYLHEGSDPREFVFNSHTCHPGQANDGLVGVATLVRLFQHLQGRRTRFSYRLVLAPEHIGTVFLLRDTAPESIERMLGGVFVEMTGIPAPLVVTSTFRGDEAIDHAVRHAANNAPGSAQITGWRLGAGNDETVWEAPGYEVPFVEMTRRRSTFAPYAEYHSSLDVPARLDVGCVNDAYRVLTETIDVLEHDCTAHRRFTGLVCLSNPTYDLYPARPDPSISADIDEVALRWGRLVDHILRWMDGSMTARQMADEVGLPFAPVRDYLDRFAAAGLVRLEPALVTRAPISQIED
jgi:aminopeptidase-like protein